MLGEPEGRGLLLDFIWALPAAVLVGVVPGWFWTKCLCATGDLAERLAYSVGFSITLVPAAALAQARLLDTGVTLPIAIASVLLVLGTGLAAYLRFGAARGSAKPIVSQPAPLNAFTLATLFGAAALMLASLLGIVSGARIALPIALLVLSGGLAHLLRSRRNATPPRSRVEPVETPGSPVAPAARGLLLAAVLALALLRSYPGPLRYDWPFPRGVDKYEHAVMTNMMLSEGDTGSFMLYPPGFHTLAALVSRLSGLEPLKLFAVLSPAMLALAALACYALGCRLWGRQAGIAAALFSGLILGGAYQHVSHARYPNLLGVLLLVLAVGALVRLYASSSVRDQLTLAVLGSSVVLYHMVASLYEAVLLGLVALVFLPYLILRERKKGLALLSSLAMLGSLSVLYAWDTYDLGRLAAGLLDGSDTGPGGRAVAMAMGTKPVFPFEHLLETSTQPAFWLGLLGALLLLAGGRSRVSPPDAVADGLARGTLLLWALLMFVGSRTVLSSFPDRFERDLSFPLALLAALAFVAALRSLTARGPVMLLAALPAVLLIGTVVAVQATQNVQEAAGPSERKIDRPPPPEVVAVGRWLKENNEGGNILVTPSVGPVSARGILAMGGYDAMQTYSEYRIRRNRDLPPFGAGPLWDSLWALRHPDGKRTRRILRENDVRYVVLEKGHPTVNRRLFERNKDLYRVVFQNEVAIVLEPDVT